MTKPISRCQVCGTKATQDVGITVESFLCNNIVCQEVLNELIKKALSKEHKENE